MGIGKGFFIERGIVNDQQGRLRMEVPCFAVGGALNDGYFFSFFLPGVTPGSCMANPLYDHLLLFHFLYRMPLYCRVATPG